MPVSDMGNVTPIMYEVCKLRPRSVLDLGVGFGAYGTLCRQVLDIEPQRIHPSTWTTKINGVEGFAGYANAIHGEVYNEVVYEDFTTKQYKDYDLVLMIDSLEHVEKPVGEKLLDEILKFNKHVIVSCPTGRFYLPQGAVNGNEFERHRAHWTQHDFTNRGGVIIYSGVCVVGSIKGCR